MANFLNDVLGGLQRLYRFERGTVKTDQLDLGGIQLVHDVSREVELGQQIAVRGFDNFSIVNTHAAGAGTVRTLQDLSAAASFWATTGADPEKDWIWLVDASLRAGSNLALTEAALVVRQAVTPVGLTTHRVMTHWWNALTTIELDASFAFLGGLEVDGNPQQIELPRLIYAGGAKTAALGGTQLVFTSKAGGAAEDIVCQVLVWIGPKGAMPPGKM